MNISCKPLATHSEQFIEFLPHAQAIIKKDMTSAVLDLIKCRRQALHKNYIAIKYMITQKTNLSQMF